MVVDGDAGKNDEKCYWCAVWVVGGKERRAISHGIGGEGEKGAVFRCVMGGRKEITTTSHSTNLPQLGKALEGRLRKNPPAARHHHHHHTPTSPCHPIGKSIKRSNTDKFVFFLFFF